MNIKFSRHSKRRMQLYNINENDVIYELSVFNEKSVLRDGKFVVIEKVKLIKNISIL